MVGPRSPVVAWGTGPSQPSLDAFFAVASLDELSPRGSSLSLNPLTLNPYCIESLLCAEGLGGAAAERNKRFFPKITARLVFKMKSSFFSPFLVSGYILSCKCQKCKKK